MLIAFWTTGPRYIYNYFSHKLYTPYSKHTQIFFGFLLLFFSLIRFKNMCPTKLWHKWVVYQLWLWFSSKLSLFTFHLEFFDFLLQLFLHDFSRPLHDCCLRIQHDDGLISILLEETALTNHQRFHTIVDLVTGAKLGNFIRKPQLLLFFALHVASWYLNQSFYWLDYTS